MRRAIRITLSDEERETLTRWGPESDGGFCWLGGRENREIAGELGVHLTPVATWRRRFAANRLAGIEREQPGRGRPAHQAQALGADDCGGHAATMPKDATHWSTRSLAKHLGVDTSLVARGGKRTNWRRTACGRSS